MSYSMSGDTGFRSDGFGGFGEQDRPPNVVKTQRRSPWNLRQRIPFNSSLPSEVMVS
jgi:hypothetical protein